MRAVFDNNILVRANPRNAGPARRLLQRFQSGPDILILSREMLQELERILFYPRLVKRFQMPAAEVAAFLTELAESSTLVVPATVPAGEKRGRPCAGINRHVVGDARALQERSSDSILTSSLAWTPSRGGWRSVDRGIDGLGD